MLFVCGKVHVAFLVALLGFLDVPRCWYRLGVETPGLHQFMNADAGAQNVDVSWAIFLLFRCAGTSERAMALATHWVDDLSRFIDSGGLLEQNLYSSVPHITLPSVCKVEPRKALRGDDKAYLTLNSFLARRTGFNVMGETDVLLRDTRCCIHCASRSCAVRVGLFCGQSPGFLFVR